MNKELFDLSGKIAVVTGAAGQLGRQYTKVLTGYGAKVVAMDVLDEKSAAVESYLADHGETDVIYIQADVTQRKQVDGALKRVFEKWGKPPFVLINNAALDSPPSASAEENGRFESYSSDSLDKVIDVNLKGVVYCCQIFGGAMANANGGSIINISSIYGMVSPDQGIYEYRRKRGDIFFKPVAYSVSKSGLYNLTRYLATYWASSNVRVNTLTLAGVYNKQDSEFLREYCRRIPAGRMAEPDEYNGAIVFLASDASKYMTGSNLVIDGGWTAW